MTELSDYTAENIAYYAYETEEEGTVPLYRLYNSAMGIHLYTPSIDERDSLLENTSEYQLEGNARNQKGVAFYIYPAAEA